MSDFWRVRLPIWCGSLIFLWLIFDGPSGFPPLERGFPAIAGFAVGSLIGLAILVILIEIPYRLIAWLFSKIKKKERNL